jgi:hypothetical protein
VETRREGALLPADQPANPGIADNLFTDPNYRRQKKIVTVFEFALLERVKTKVGVAAERSAAKSVVTRDGQFACEFEFPVSIGRIPCKICLLV